MYKTVTKTVAGATSCSAVGRETTQKSRVSPKNERSRGNKSKYLLLLFGLCCVALQSCVSTYYQVYKVEPAAEVKQSGNSLVFEDENCKVLYDFWGEGGDVGFMIYNKTDKDIFVNMKESFFICNGIAYDYFKNREFTSNHGISHFYSASFSSWTSFSSSKSSTYSSSATNAYSANASIIGAISESGYNYQGFKQTNSVAAGLGVSTSRSNTTSRSNINSSSRSETYGTTTSKGIAKTFTEGVNVKEKDVVCIPPKSAKVISEYHITDKLYRDCNLFLKPTKHKKYVKTKVVSESSLRKSKQFETEIRNLINTSTFSEANSPFVFGNRITYTIDGQNIPVKIEQNFYISEITNYPEKELITEAKINKPCEDEIYLKRRKVKYFKDVAPDKFYIRYGGYGYRTKH